MCGMPKRTPRPRGDWPTIIGTIFGGLALIVSLIAYFFPKASESGQPANSPAQAAARESWFAQHTGLWIYLGFVGLLVIAYMLFRWSRRPVVPMLWIVGAGIAFELTFWDLMNQFGQLASVVVIAGAPVWITGILAGVHGGPVVARRQPDEQSPMKTSKEEVKAAKEESEVPTPASNAAAEALRQYLEGPGVLERGIDAMTSGRNRLPNKTPSADGGNRPAPRTSVENLPPVAQFPTWPPAEESPAHERDS